MKVKVTNTCSTCYT